MKYNYLFREYKQQLIAFMSMIAVVIVLSFISEYFFTVGNIFNIGKQASINLIIALGMTLVIITEGIDLSVGSLMALTISVMAVLNVVHGVNIVAAAIIAVILTVLMGMLNGVIIHYGRVPAFITTLGMMGILRGVVLLISRGNPSMSFPKEFLWIADGTILTIPIPIIITLTASIIIAFILKYTPFGRSVYSLGGNEEAARLSGISIPFTRILTYTISGLCCAIGGLIFAARVGASPPSAGTGYEMNAIAAVIIGGTPLTGGQGKISGTVIGAVLMAVISNGLNIIEVDPYWQGIVVGAIIVFAVMMSNMKKKGS